MKIMNIIHELYYDRTDIFEGTDFNKTTKSKDCDICLYCYFLNKGFKFNRMYAVDVSIYQKCL